MTTHTEKPLILSGIRNIAGHYDVFLLDLWGLIHDGRVVYPGVIDCLKQLKAAGKTLILLSNTPRTTTNAAQLMNDDFGVTPDLYDHIVTSGAATRRSLQQIADGVHPVINGTSLYHLPPLRMYADLYDGLPLNRVDDIANADFLLNTTTLDVGGTADVHDAVFKIALERNIPMLCANPDREVNSGSNDILVGSGATAARYADMGGIVHYCGKPHGDIYTIVYEILDGRVPKSRIIALGDGLPTDIQGAVTEGLHCALNPGGILGAHVDFNHATGDMDADKLHAILARQEFHPTYIIPGFRW